MWKGVFSVIVALVGVATTTQRTAVDPSLVCKEECDRFFSLHTNQLEQINDSWGCCVHGCDFFQRIQARMGDDPIRSLKNCNFSCDERYAGEDVHACQAGCGFNYDVATSQLPPSPRIESVPPSSQPFIIPLNLPKLFGQLHRAMPRLDQIVERTFSPFNGDFSFSMPRIPALSSLPAMPRLPGGFLGRKDTEEVELEGNSGGSSINDFLSSINDQMNSMMQSMPAMPRIDNLNPWTAFPFGQQSKSGGKITVVNAGPGFIEEKHYDIKPDGEIVEVTNAPRLVDNDGLNHNNPMESKVLDAETEVIQPEFDPADLPADEAESDVRDKLKDEPAAANDGDSPIETVADVEKIDNAPVDNADTAGDNNVVVNKEAAMAIPLVEARPELKMDLSEVDPFLHILRNSISERERSQLYNKYQYKLLNSRNHNNQQYVDNNSCSSEHLRWSDWVGCVHVRLGVPRWLTAATIALGIVFSVWLCFIIPTAAPKQRLAHLMIHTEKLALPSTVKSKQLTTAEAKAAEAEASNEAVIAVIKVDLPPSYGDVTPGSPAPSYKSDMLPAVPGSPAPSYKSVDLPVKMSDDDKPLEPVHGKDSQA